MKNALILGGLLVLVLLGGVWWSTSLEDRKIENSNVDESEVLSKNGMHQHPRLEIYVDGERQDIPSNIGVGPQNASAPTYDPGMKMTAMHTHEPDGTIHLEFPNRVTKEDVKLKNFFSIWGKDFMDFGSSVTMAVNGNENNELGEYVMKDGDQIILKYTKE